METKTFQIVDNDISDGYHTFAELYTHRCLLFIAWMLSDGRPGECYFVKNHYDGWDLVVCEVPSIGQISYHIPIKYRCEYEKHMPEKCSLEHEWDGHTSRDVWLRLEEWITR